MKTSPHNASKRGFQRGMICLSFFKDENGKKVVSKRTRTCGLCKNPFVAAARFSLFCESCKEHNERYRFAEWLTA